MTWLQVPYVANIVLLLPVGPGALFNLWSVSDERFADSAGWRTIAGAQWSAILICSVLGLIYPVAFCPLLVMQEIYKTLWLGVYVGPRMMGSGRRREIHWPMTIIFLLIVGLYPWVIHDMTTLSSRVR